jgi:uncharacterized protein with PIN domain
MKPLNSEQIKSLVQAIEQTREHEFSCRECQSCIAEFAERQLAGQPINEILARVEHHLSLCPECREQFVALEKILHENR